MSKLTLTIEVVLAVVLTAMVYTTGSIEIKALMTLLDLPILLLIVNHLSHEEDRI